MNDWYRRHYQKLMLLAMFVELLLLGWIVWLDYLTYAHLRSLR